MFISFIFIYLNKRNKDDQAIAAQVGQLGLGHNDHVFLPTPIPNLPKINMISCGSRFTVCVDHEGFIWSFGKNNSGKLGTGNTINFNVPQKLVNIPPVVSVSWGSKHTLIIK